MTQPDNPLHQRFGAPWPQLDLTPLAVSLGHDNPWSDITDPSVVSHGQLTRIALLRHGTKAGRASIALLVRLDDGRLVVAETTYRLFATAARAIAASPAAAEED